MLLRWVTFGVWAVLAASMVHWGLKLWVRPPTLPQAAQVADAGPAIRGDWSRLLGVEAPTATAAAPEPATDARFTLVGVVSPRRAQDAREGVALIGVDGKPPKAFRVGATVDGQNTLKTVSQRGAVLGPKDSAGTITLNLTPPPQASTATLPPAAGLGNPPAPVPENAPQVVGSGTPPSLAPTALPPGMPPVSRPGDATAARPPTFTRDSSNTR